MTCGCASTRPRRASKTATLTVASAVGDLLVSLTGTGTQTELSRSPATLAFGPRDVDDGPTATQTSTVTNTGTEPVTLTALTLAGGDAAQFARLTGAPADCTSTTALNAGQTCELRVRFDPATTGAKSATLTVVSNAADVTVALTGTGTQTELSRSPATLRSGRATSMTARPPRRRRRSRTPAPSRSRSARRRSPAATRRSSRG